MRFTTLCITTFGTLIAVATACSSDGGTTDASGGTSNTGGTTTTGGTTSTGGASNSGGTPGTGGVVDCKDEGYFTAEDAGISVGVGAYDYGDDAGSCVALTAAEGEICIEGTAAQVVNNMWDEIWGAGLGIKLAEDTGTVDASGYSGISFTIDNVPAGLRAGVMMSGDANSYFTTDVTAGENTIFFEDLANGEWVTPAGTLDTSVLVDIQWQVPSTADGAVDFDFCVSDVEFVGGGGAGGMGGNGP